MNSLSAQSAPASTNDNGNGDANDFTPSIQKLQDASCPSDACCKNPISFDDARKQLENIDQVLTSEGANERAVEQFRIVCARVLISATQYDTRQIEDVRHLFFRVAGKVITAPVATALIIREMRKHFTGRASVAT